MIDIDNLPKSMFSGEYNKGGHVQGIATDGEYMYFSFTTFLLKTDLNGRPVGSVDGLLGHLGCIAYYNGYIYGSLEYKNDSIGKGILKKLDSDAVLSDAFYIVRFDAAKINRMDMDAVLDGVLGAVLLTDVCEDYTSHRYGCSGIDGVTVCNYPDGIPSIYVAYGIYSDINRTDNDNQVILRIALDKIDGVFSPLSQTEAANAAEIRADEKIFVYTGNTNYGIQNLEYDPGSNKLIAAVYPGKKPQFHNYPMFIIDLESDYTTKGNERYYNAQSVSGLEFEYGSTGIIALGHGYYYFSKDGKNEKGYYTNVCLYKADKDKNFALV